MKIIHFRRVITWHLAMLAAAQLHAQELNLFEPTESEAAQPARPFAPDQAFQPSANGQPAYTLRSLSRFGDRYQATLINRAGEPTKVNWRAGETAPVQNSGFTIVAASGGSLSLTHPGGDACVAAPSVGVSCAGDRSELRLTAAAPLASNGVNTSVGPMPGPGGFSPNDPLGINAIQAQQQGFVNEAGQQVFINPFSGEPEVVPQISEEERAARAQRQQLRADRLRQFQQGVQVIPDEAIPPGMERVRTPFGDTLIPRRQ